MKRRVLIMSLLLSVVLTACGSKETATETSATITNETEVNKDSAKVSEEVNVETTAEAETIVEEKKEAECYICGEVYDEDGRFTGEYKRILPISKPDGFIYYGESNLDNVKENDAYRLYYTRKNKIFIEIGIFDRSFPHLGECVKLLLGDKDYQSYLVENAGNFFEQEILPSSLEKKDSISTIYGDIQNIYIIANGSDHEPPFDREGRPGEGSYEFAVLNINGYDVYFKCIYGEVADYKGILVDAIPQMLVEDEAFAPADNTSITYGDYDYVMYSSFGYNIPEGYTDDGEGSIKNETGDMYNIYIKEMSKEYDDLELYNFLQTGTFDEGDSEDYKITLMEDHGTVETAYGPARIVFERGQWTMEYYQEENAIEYVVLNVNGKDIVIYGYYTEVSDYKGVIESLLPAMLEAKGN